MRKQRIALLDPVNQIAYSRTVRKDNAGYKEDGVLQNIWAEKGLEAARRFASRQYHGVYVAVMPDYGSQAVTQ